MPTVFDVDQGTFKFSGRGDVEATEDGVGSENCGNDSVPFEFWVDSEAKDRDCLNFFRQVSMGPGTRAMLVDGAWNSRRGGRSRGTSSWSRGCVVMGRYCVERTVVRAMARENLTLVKVRLEGALVRRL